MHGLLRGIFLEHMAGAEGFRKSLRQRPRPPDVRYVAALAGGAYVGSPGDQPGPGQQGVAAVRLQVHRCVGCQLCQQALLRPGLLPQVLQGYGASVLVGSGHMRCCELAADVFAFALLWCKNDSHTLDRDSSVRGHACEACCQIG